MTVLGTNLVQNCRECFIKCGYGINLVQQGNSLACPNCHAAYQVVAGYAKRQ